MDERTDILLLIQARLYGWSGSLSEKAAQLDLYEQTVACLLKGQETGLTLEELKAIGRKIGIPPKLLLS